MTRDQLSEGWIGRWAFKIIIRVRANGQAPRLLRLQAHEQPEQLRKRRSFIRRTGSLTPCRDSVTVVPTEQDISISYSLHRPDRSGRVKAKSIARRRNTFAFEDMTKMVNRTLYPVRARKVYSLLAPFIFQIPINCLAQLIIPSAEMEPDQILATKPLVGFKTLPQEMFDIAHANRATGIPVDFFVASAASTAKVVTSMEGQGQDPSTATPADWWRASKWSMSVSTEKSAKPKLETWQFPGKPDTIYDPELIVSLADTELFVSKNPVIYASYVGDQKLEWIQADPHAWMALNKYQTLTTTRIRSDWEAPNLFVTVNDIVASYPRMKNTMRFESGHVSFGKVVIQTPKDAGLKVSPHVTGKGDLFVLKLSVSFHDLGSLTDKDIEEQTFGVEILSPKDVYASDLIPLKYDALPDASTQNVSVGRYHEQEFIYASLRPIVVAAGLQETRFSWKLSGGAVGVGTRRFVAIVRVPNDAMSLIMTLSANLKSHTWGLPFETIRHADHRTDVKLPKR